MSLSDKVMNVLGHRVIEDIFVKDAIKELKEICFKYAEKKDREDIWIGVRKCMGQLKRVFGDDLI